jgi:hypothetical protein
MPGPSPVRASGSLFPNRAAMQAPYPPVEPGEVPLTPAGVEPPPFADPLRSSMPGGWVPGGDDQRRQSFGTLGVIAATILLMVLVFFGAKMLMG